MLMPVINLHLSHLPLYGDLPLHFLIKSVKENPLKCAAPRAGKAHCLAIQKRAIQKAAIINITRNTIPKRLISEFARPLQ